MKHEACFICGAEIIYKSESELMKCDICGQEFESNAACANSHFVCDVCHQAEGVEFIENACLNSKEKDPFKLASLIMNHQSIKLHGPEHHFLVPAVMLTTYYNFIGDSDKIKPSLAKAKKRSANVLGGFCGFYGTCGAGMGNGIFLSIVLNSNPLSGDEYSTVNMITGKTLIKVAEAGGPRCCKRNTFIAMETAVEFLKQKFDLELPLSDIKCKFSFAIKECKFTDCNYYE
ncbi:MAG: SAM-dependent methyltransferase [Marinilabiliales bacterium]|nr:MAG: SAM-dependent methyltransferase [Marinilabiliales bacterium]